MRPRTSDQSLSSYIYEHLDELEHLIGMGIYQDAICQQLSHADKTPSLATFKKSLARARQKRLRLSPSPDTRTPPTDPKHQADRHDIPGGRLSVQELELLENNWPLDNRPVVDSGTRRFA
jgi:hypothetical protein